PLTRCTPHTPQSRSTPCPYTTLFRSERQRQDHARRRQHGRGKNVDAGEASGTGVVQSAHAVPTSLQLDRQRGGDHEPRGRRERLDRKSTRLNSSHGSISYAVFCLKKK